MAKHVMDPEANRGEEIDVLFVLRRKAKGVKTQLEKDGRLNKHFRMTPAMVALTSLNTTATATAITPIHECIAVPIVTHLSATKDSQSDLLLLDGVEGMGRQFCPYSSAVLGSRGQKRGSSRGSQTGSVMQQESSMSLSTVQKALLKAILSTVDTSALFGLENAESIVAERVRQLDAKVCPRSLEILGDDHTIVIPNKSLNVEHGNEDSFKAFLLSVGVIDGIDTDSSPFLSTLWMNIADLSRSPRVVRKGEIDPNSPIRESGYRILWRKADDVKSTIVSAIVDEENSIVSTIVDEENSNDDSHATNSTTLDNNRSSVESPMLQSYDSELSGPGSPGWITVTEQGIRQSFDLTKVMFSRGNISEKIRFGKLVQRGERVLDLYGGIGYFTLPALVHGGADHVVVCEWNEYALQALKFNLHDNGVADRSTVYAGDCRAIVEENDLVDQFDRVSLGLLPSSEGGWGTAVKALHRSTGGWLHIHGNVPAAESIHWGKWVCCCLLSFVRSNHLSDDWLVVGSHLEKVKSFAPTVNHYVLDVYLGPPSNAIDTELSLPPGKSWFRHSQKGFEDCSDVEGTPSCALSPTGVLNQDWMR